MTGRVVIGHPARWHLLATDLRSPAPRCGTPVSAPEFRQEDDLDDRGRARLCRRCLAWPGRVDEATETVEVHGAGRYRNHRCRCQTCVRGHSEAQADRRRRAAEKGLAEDDPRHGTPNGYNYWGCRCAACRAAATSAATR